MSDVKVRLPSGLVFQASHEGSRWVLCAYHECAVKHARLMRRFGSRSQHQMCRWNDRYGAEQLKVMLDFVRVWKDAAGDETPVADILLQLHEGPARPLVEAWLYKHTINLLTGAVTP